MKALACLSPSPTQRALEGLEVQQVPWCKYACLAVSLWPGLANYFLAPMSPLCGEARALRWSQEVSSQQSYELNFFGICVMVLWPPLPGDNPPHVTHQVPRAGGRDDSRMGLLRVVPQPGKRERITIQG